MVFMQDYLTIRDNVQIMDSNYTLIKKYITLHLNYKDVVATCPWN